MPEENVVQLANAGPVAKKPKDDEKNISLKKADKWISKSGLRRIKAFKVRAHAKIGRFIAQEGEVDQARTMIRNNYEGLLEQQEYCEERVEEAKKNKDEEGIKEWMDRLVVVMHEINTTAKFAIAAKIKSDQTADDDGPRVATMPPRVTITNNNQIGVGIATTEKTSSNGH